MLKKQYLTLIASAVILAGCGDGVSSEGESKATVEQYLVDMQARSTTIDFTLQGRNAWVPPPSALLMDTQDGTLKLPTGGDDALSNPKAAMNTADGWPLTMPISLRFEGAGFTPNTFITSGITILQLSGKLTDDTPPTVTKALVSGTDYNVITSADSINIAFTSSLDEKANYIFALTDSIVDKDANKLGTSSSYATLKSANTNYTAGSLQSAQKVVKGVEQYMAGAGVTTTEIVYSAWFTTQSVGDSLYSTKGLIAKSISDLSTIWKGSANPNNIDFTGAYGISFGTTQDFAAALNSDTNFDKYIAENTDVTAKKSAILASYTASSVSVTNGTIKLPYFLESSPATFSTTPFVSAMPSMALISNGLKDSVEGPSLRSQFDALNIKYANLETDPNERAKLIGIDLKKSDGSVFDSERVITQYSPIPKIKSLPDVPFLLFTPTTPTGAFPLVVYSHGITSAKENAYAYAASMVNDGNAVIVIDHPLHGQRSLSDSVSANKNILYYLNLTYLPVARDNMRQSILDTLGLRAAISLAQSAGFSGTPLASLDNTSTNPPRFLGHSLGGITGTTAVGIANATIGNTTGDALFKFSAAAFPNAGGQIGNLLLASESYGPLIKHNLAKSASTDYANFATTNCTSLDEVACYNLFDSLASAEDKAKLQAGFNSFIYAAQTVVDAIDPYTMAHNSTDYAALPILIQQALNDDTVPNNAGSSAPFAGTTPLATKLGLTTASASSTDVARVFVKFNSTAKHTTVIAPTDKVSTPPADYNHHLEMQRQLRDFFKDIKLDSVDNSNSVLE